VQHHDFEFSLEVGAAASRSFSACRFCDIRMIGAWMAVSIERNRLRIKVREPLNSATVSAARCPNVAASSYSLLVGCLHTIKD
jgi:hypothetical protein